MQPRWNVHRSERGAIFVQVGVAILVLMAFNVFVIDYGMLWVARRQAQNAADAGALAGAIGMAYDRYVTGQTTGTVLFSAMTVAEHAANKVWQPGAKAVATATCPSGVTGTCVQVNVYRNGTNGSIALPALFGPILGVTSQNVQASAVGIIGRGNTTNCLKPWALPDEWQHGRDPADEFNAYAPPTAAPLTPADSYVPPSATQALSRNLSSDYGTLIRFDVNRPLDSPIWRGDSAARPAFMLPLTLPGTNTHMENMTACNGLPISIGQRLPIDVSVVGNLGNAAENAAQAAYGLDATADWASELGGNGFVANSCAPGCTPFAAVSPRLWAVALYSPEDLDKQRTSTPQWLDCPGNNPCVLVANIAGFFVDYLDHGATNGRHGHLVRYPGVTMSGQPLITEDGTWLVEPRLIR